MAENPQALLYSNGDNVGVLDGQMGNSEVFIMFVRELINNPC